MEHFLTFIRKRLDRWILPRENFQTTDSAKGNDFRRAIVSVKSEKAAKRQMYSKAPLYAFPRILQLNSQRNKSLKVSLFEFFV